jgi:hypothetical protein
LGDLALDGIILKWILKIRMLKCELDSTDQWRALVKAVEVLYEAENILTT